MTGHNHLDLLSHIGIGSNKLTLPTHDHPVQAPQPAHHDDHHPVSVSSILAPKDIYNHIVEAGKYW